MKDIVSADSRSNAGEYISGSQFWVFIHLASLDSSRTTRRRGRPQKNHLLHFSAPPVMAGLTLALLSMIEEERYEFWTSASKTLAAALCRPLTPEVDYKLLRFLTPHVDACLRYNPSELDPDTYSIVENYALLYSKLGRWEDAAKLNKDWLDKNMEKLGDGSSLVLACMIQLALDYGKLGRTSEAIELEQHIVNAKMRILGDDHDEVLRAMVLLAIDMSNSQPEQAVELHEQVLKIRRRDLGEEHQSTLSAISLLADSYERCGRSQDALKLQTQVYDIQKRLRGEEHLDTIRSMVRLAYTYTSTKQFQDAVVLLERAVELRKNLQGGGYPELLVIMDILVVAYFCDEQFQNAFQVKEQLLKLSKEKLGDEHPTTLRREKLLADFVSAIETQSDSESNAPEREINELDSRFSQQGKRRKRWWFF